MMLPEGRLPHDHTGFRPHYCRADHGIILWPEDFKGHVVHIVKRLQMSTEPRSPKACPRCGGRLFLEDQPMPFPGKAWVCLNCGHHDDPQAAVPGPRHARERGPSSGKVQL